jgi:DNA ligase (NAD+)
MNDLSFIAYEIMTFGNNTETPEATKSFSILNALGFEVVDSGFLATPTIFDIITLYKSKRESSLYSIDGLVLSLNIPKPPIKQGVINPTHTVAFKMRLEEQIRKTKVLNVEWNISRYGRLVPVVSYESVYVDGIRMHRASGHNAAHIRDWSLGKGSIIKVVRSGDVIPTIIDCEVNEAIEPIFPNLIPSWHWKGNDIYLDDIDGNRTVQIMRMNHFFATIGVPRLREKTLEKLWNFGLKDIKAITNAKPTDFIKIKGIGKKSAEGHYRNIHEVMRKTRLDRFIPAVTSTTLGIGRKLVKQLMRYHPSILEDEEDVIRRMLTKKKIPGFGPKRIESVASNIPKFKEFLFSLNEEDIKYAIKQDKEQRERIKAVGYNQKIRGKMFVTTGFFGHMDIELEDYIYDNLGNFSDLVTSGTTAVIAANLLSSSKKMVAALQLNIPVLSLQEFVKSFDIPYAKLKDDEDPDADIVSKDPEDREE